MRLTLFTALMLAAVPALAAPLDAPPAFTGKAVEAQPVTEPAAKAPAADGYNDLAPTEEDMRRARAERAQTARDGSRILMELVDEWGYAPSEPARTLYFAPGHQD